MGRHLLFSNWTVTSSEAILPTLPKIAFVDRLNERLALVTEHLSCLTQIWDFANDIVFAAITATFLAATDQSNSYTLVWFNCSRQYEFVPCNTYMAIV